MNFGYLFLLLLQRLLLLLENDDSWLLFPLAAMNFGYLFLQMILRDQQQQQKRLQQQEEKPAKIHRKRSQNHHFLWVSKVTLGISRVQFWGFSVLHCHGVFPSGDQQQQQNHLQEKVAKIHSSKRKKQPGIIIF